MDVTRKPIPLSILTLILACCTWACDDGSSTDSAMDAAVGDMPAGADIPANQNVVSGSRLKARWIEPEEGDPVFRGWWDSQMEVECQFQTAMDGETRCLPAPDLRQALDRGFSDSACSSDLVVERVVREPQGCAPDRFFVTQTTSECPARMKVEVLAAELPDTDYYVSEQGMCHPVTLSPGWRLHALDGEIAAEDWVRATVTIGESTDNVAPRFFTGDDGSSGYLGLVDTALGNFPCRYQQAADGVFRCLPAEARQTLVWENIFVDDGTCSTYLASPTVVGCESYGARYDDRGSCDPRFSIHELLEPFSGEFILDQTGTCEGEPQPGDGYVTTGPELPPEGFGTYETLDPVGESRLQSTRSETSGGLTLGGGWYDTEREQGCAMVVASDGSMRCVPSALWHSSHYADSACTQRLYRVYSECQAAALPSLVRFDNRNACPATSQFFELGEVYAGTVFSLYENEGCTEDASASGLMLYTEGAEVMPSAFVAGVERIDD